MDTHHYALGGEDGPLVVLTERSAGLDLTLISPRIQHDTRGDITTATLPDLEPDQIVRAALQMLRIASCRYEEYEFMNAVRAVVIAEHASSLSSYLRETIVAAYDALPRLD